MKGITEACAPNSPFPFIPCLEEGEIDVDDLEAVLKQALGDVEGDQGAKKKLLKDSNFRKCIRIYDFLRYGKSEVPHPSPIVRTTAFEPRSSWGTCSQTLCSYLHIWNCTKPLRRRKLHTSEIRTKGRIDPMGVVSPCC